MTLSQPYFRESSRPFPSDLAWRTEGEHAVARVRRWAPDPSEETTSAFHLWHSDDDPTQRWLPDVTDRTLIPGAWSTPPPVFAGASTAMPRPHATNRHLSPTEHAYQLTPFVSMPVTEPSPLHHMPVDWGPFAPIQQPAAAFASAFEQPMPLPAGLTPSRTPWAWLAGFALATAVAFFGWQLYVVQENAATLTAKFDTMRATFATVLQRETDARLRAERALNERLGELQAVRMGVEHITVSTGASQRTLPRAGVVSRATSKSAAQKRSRAKTRSAKPTISPLKHRPGVGDGPLTGIDEDQTQDTEIEL